MIIINREMHILIQETEERSLSSQLIKCKLWEEYKFSGYCCSLIWIYFAFLFPYLLLYFHILLVSHELHNHFWEIQEWGRDHYLPIWPFSWVKTEDFFLTSLADCCAHNQEFSRKMWEKVTCTFPGPSYKIAFEHSFMIFFSFLLP